MKNYVKKLYKEKYGYSLFPPHRLVGRAVYFFLLILSVFPFLAVPWEAGPNFLLPYQLPWVEFSQRCQGQDVRALTVFSLTSSCFDTQLLIVVVCFRGCYCLHPLLLRNSSSHWILGNPASSFLKVRKPSNLGLFDKLNILLPSHFSSLGSRNFHCCYSLGASVFLICSLYCASLRGGPLFQHASLKTTKSVSYQNCDRYKDYNRGTNRSTSLFNIHSIIDYLLSAYRWHWISYKVYISTF